jgi:hypothetical protein
MFLWQDIWAKHFRSSMASGHMLMNSCAVQYFEESVGQQTSIIYCSNITWLPLDRLILRVRLPGLALCIDSSTDQLRDAPQTTGLDGVGDDPRQLENTFVLNEPNIDSGYIIGAKPGVCCSV